MSIGNDVRDCKSPDIARRAHLLAGFRFLDHTLRGCGQVIFMNSPVTGLLNLAAMFWGAYAGGATPAVAIGSLVGALVSTATAYPLHAERGALRSGLMGFNGMLLGAGIPTFLANTPVMWVVLILAAAMVTVVTLAADAALRRVKVPGLTFPYVFATWTVLLAAYKFPMLGIASLPPPALPSQVDALGTVPGLQEFVHASLASVSQVYFVDNPVSGAIFLVALVVHSRWCAGLAAFGAMAAVACALAVGADPVAVRHGLWGYSAVLTAPAVGCIFMRPTPRTFAYCAAATLSAVFVQAALATLTQAVGIPPLTFPFVLTTWLFLLARRDSRDASASASSAGKPSQ